MSKPANGKLRVVDRPQNTPTHPVRVRAARRDDPAMAIQRLKARIRATPLGDLEQVCHRNGLLYKSDAPNEGIKAMRVHNSIVNAFIAGKPVEGLCD